MDLSLKRTGTLVVWREERTLTDHNGVVIQGSYPSVSSLLSFTNYLFIYIIYSPETQDGFMKYREHFSQIAQSIQDQTNWTKITKLEKNANKKSLRHNITTMQKID